MSFVFVPIVPNLPIEILLLPSRAFRIWIQFRLLHNNFMLRHTTHLFHPLRIIQLRTKVLKLPTKPPHPSRTPTLLFEQPIARVASVPMGVIRRVSGQANKRLWRRDPMREGGPVRANHFLRVLWNDRVGETRRSSLPDMCATVGRVRN